MCSLPLNCQVAWIYKITHTTNGFSYIGSSMRKTVESRWQRHRKDLRKGVHHNRHLQRAWNKYGEKSFEFSIIEECPDADVLLREQFYIDSSTKLYNINPIAGSCRGRRFSLESLQKMRNSHLSKSPSQETRERQVKCWERKGRSVDLVGPDGTVYKDVRAWRNFCKTHSLDHCAISVLFRRRCHILRGWHLLNNPPPTYSFVSPTGELFEGITSMKDFATLQGTSMKGLSRVHTGARRSYKGWRRSTPITSLV